MEPGHDNEAFRDGKHDETAGVCVEPPTAGTRQGSLHDAHRSLVDGNQDPDPDAAWTESHELIFDVGDHPPIHIALAYAIQQAFTSVSGCITTVFIIYPLLCPHGDTLLLTQLMSSTVFIAGIATLLQASIGIRLPIVQGSSFAFLPPVVAIMTSESWHCPEMTDTLSESFGNHTLVDGEAATFWGPRIAELSGGLILASLVQVSLGLSGVIGHLLRRVGPLTIVPTVSLVGLAMFPAVSDACRHSWTVAGFGVAAIIVFSLALRHVKVTVPTWSRSGGIRYRQYPIFQLFAPAFALGSGWLLCYILTVTNVFPDDPSHRNYGARTDANLRAIETASWLYLPYPGQFGWPTFGASAFIGMLAATLSSIVESIGDYYATARICALKPPPKHTVNRGIAIEGLSGVMSGLFGICHGNTSYSGVIGFIGVTGMAARFTWQVFGVLFICCGLCGKLGAVLSIIPKPVIGANMLVGLGMVVTVALSNVTYVDMRAPRNMMILGVSLMTGLMLPFYLKENPGAIKTGSREVDQVLTVMLSTAMLVGGLLGFTLDNIIPGSRKLRGLEGFNSGSDVIDVGGDVTARSQKAFDLPYISDWLRRQTGWLTRVPFLPSYVERPLCRCSGTKALITKCVETTRNERRDAPPTAAVQRKGSVDCGSTVL